MGRVLNLSFVVSDRTVPTQAGSTYLLLKSRSSCRSSFDIGNVGRRGIAGNSLNFMKFSGFS